MNIAISIIAEHQNIAERPFELHYARGEGAEQIQLPD